uniref:Uncharacterized protein n=1 Tax=Glossina palpalis gambiensis TaxID=67801 RepID=A0A1B0BP08_9MUSC
MQKFFKLIKCEIREKSGHQNIRLRTDLSVVLSTFISDSLYPMDKCLRRQHLIIRVKSSQVKSSQIKLSHSFPIQFGRIQCNEPLDSSQHHKYNYHYHARLSITQTEKYT